MIGLLKCKRLKSFKRKLEVCLTERLNEFGVSAFGIFQMILSRSLWYQVGGFPKPIFSSTKYACKTLGVVSLFFFSSNISWDILPMSSHCSQNVKETQYIDFYIIVTLSFEQIMSHLGCCTTLVSPVLPSTYYRELMKSWGYHGSWSLPYFAAGGHWTCVRLSLLLTLLLSFFCGFQNWDLLFSCLLVFCWIWNLSNLIVCHLTILFRLNWIISMHLWRKCFWKYSEKTI